MITVTEFGSDGAEWRIPTSLSSLGITPETPIIEIAAAAAFQKLRMNVDADQNTVTFQSGVIS